MNRIDTTTKARLRDIFPAVDYDCEGDYDGAWIRTNQWGVDEEQMQAFLQLPLTLVGLIVEGDNHIVLIVKTDK